jgi:hypothetical protein
LKRFRIPVVFFEELLEVLLDHYVPIKQLFDQGLRIFFGRALYLFILDHYIKLLFVIEFVEILTHHE